jgi:hypothetical protein
MSAIVQSDSPSLSVRIEQHDNPFRIMKSNENENVVGVMRCCSVQRGGGPFRVPEMRYQLAADGFAVYIM